MNDQSIKASVQAYYGEWAEHVQQEQPKTSCCSSSHDISLSSTLYRDTATADLPATAVNSTRGCGNPVVRAALKPGQVVLDLGSGGGLDVLLAAKQVGPSGFVYGVDMTDAMLDLARQNAHKAQIENVAFLKGDIEQLPLENEQVDVIISNCVINLAPDKGMALREAYRVLKVGGYMAISDIVIDGSLTDFPLPEASLRAAMNWAGCVAGAPTREQYQQFLEQAGFQAISFEVTHRYSFEDIGGKLPEELAGLSDLQGQQLAERFTSCLIRAHKQA